MLNSYYNLKKKIAACIIKDYNNHISGNNEYYILWDLKIEKIGARQSMFKPDSKCKIKW